MKVVVTEELIKKIFYAHKKGLKTVEISNLLGVSKDTVKRIVKMMLAAEQGDFDTLLNYKGADSFKKTKKIVLTMYAMYAMPNNRVGCEVQKNPKSDTEMSNQKSDTEMSKIEELIKHTNELLARLCMAWQA